MIGFYQLLYLWQYVQYLVFNFVIAIMTKICINVPILEFCIIHIMVLSLPYFDANQTEKIDFIFECNIFCFFHSIIKSDLNVLY
jgi:hypothetical protein